MRSARCWWLAGLVGTVWMGAARAQDDDFPPEFQIVGWFVTDPDTLETTTVYSLNPPFGDINDVSQFPHKELDTVFAVLRIFDFNWDITRNETELPEPPEVPERPDYEGVFLGMIGASTFFIPCFVITEDIFVRFTLTGPVPPPVQVGFGFFPTVLNQLLGPLGTDEDGFTPNMNDVPGDNGRPFIDVLFSFRLPEFVGRSQQRLQGTKQFDSDYCLTFLASNETSDNVVQGLVFGEGDLAVVIDAFTIGLNDNPSFAPGNAPPFASALAPTLVESGQRVILDGTRTFDSSNTGFDPFTPPEDNEVFERDNLIFAWEWVSGPERVDPEQDEQSDPYAAVILVEPGTYTYRLIVSDSSGSPPTSDIVEIEVVEQLALNNAPVPVIQGPTEAVQIGEIIALDATLTSDADGDVLKYQWRQTNAFGEPLLPEEIQDAFQPLSGTNARESQWQAVEAGTFYFTLLVSDGKTRPTAQYIVQVSDNGTQGTVDQSDDQGAVTDDLEDDLSVNPLVSAGACGAGLLPAVLTPLVLPALRRRR